MVGKAGFEPAAPCSQSRCADQTALLPEVNMCVGLSGDSNPDHRLTRPALCQLSYRGMGRAGGIRTHDLFVPNEARCQAAPQPVVLSMVGMAGLEPATS